MWEKMQVITLTTAFAILYGSRIWFVSFFLKKNYFLIINSSYAKAKKIMVTRLNN